ncbi:hypothetical protein N7530_002468 [Penicillium desertorum]|uniref:Uncharacterized protein n=1 Tax=Penicillium desertorum TaxID=1303715 RepID=A0A9W9X3F1_9EURO|nr:hypothetical protein N7530_002468 [Penicillium desertorum]
MLMREVGLLSLFLLGAVADTKCYFCSTASYLSPEAPTHSCGEKCGYQYYHDIKCWRSDHAMNDCFKNCCEEGNMVATHYNCDNVLSECY